jgi:hypothetical protein
MNQLGSVANTAAGPQAFNFVRHAPLISCPDGEAGHNERAFDR